MEWPKCDPAQAQASTNFDKLMKLTEQLDRIEGKLDKLIETLPRYDEIADLENMTIPEIEGLEDKDAK